MEFIVDLFALRSLTKGSLIHQPGAKPGDILFPKAPQSEGPCRNASTPGERFPKYLFKDEPFEASHLAEVLKMHEDVGPVSHRGSGKKSTIKGKKHFKSQQNQ